MLDVMSFMGLFLLIFCHSLILCHDTEDRQEGDDSAWRAVLGCQMWPLPAPRKGLLLGHTVTWQIPFL